MMCFPSIDSLVKKVDSNYTLVPDAKNKKPVTVALEEIYKDKITYSFDK